MVSRGYMKKPVTVNKSYTLQYTVILTYVHISGTKNVYQVQKVFKISNKELLTKTKKVKINKKKSLKGA